MQEEIKTKFKENSESPYELKKRKIRVEICKNDAKSLSFNEIFASLDENKKLFLLVKVLLFAHKKIPNTVSILDKLIEKIASTFIPASTIFGSSNSTYSEVDHIINLTDRKQKLLNIFVMGDELISSLPDSLKEIALLKYEKNYLSDEIAAAVKVSPRTIYRKLKLIDEKLLLYAKKTWSLGFIINQIKDEPWLRDLLKKKLRDEISNLSRSMALRSAKIS